MMKPRQTLRRLRPFFATGLFAFLAAGCFGDTVITLTTGQQVTGTFLDATSTAVRLRDGQGITEEIPIAKITRIQFQEDKAPLAGNVKTNAPPEPAAPGEQQKFCAVLAEYRAAVLHPNDGANPILQAKTKTNPSDPLSYESEIAEAFVPNARFTKWIGTITFGVFNKSIVIRFVPDCPEAADVADFANSSERPFLPAAIASTVIPLNSSLANQLSNMPAKSRVTISGNLLAMPRDPNFPRSWYKPPAHPKFMNNASGPATGATVAQPHYLAHFTEVEPLTEGHANQSAPK